MSEEWKAPSVEESRAALEEFLIVRDEDHSKSWPVGLTRDGLPVVFTVHEEFHRTGSDAEIVAEMTRLIRAARRRGDLQ